MSSRRMYTTLCVVRWILQQRFMSIFCVYSTYKAPFKAFKHCEELFILVTCSKRRERAWGWSDICTMLPWHVLCISPFGMTTRNLSDESAGGGGLWREKQRSCKMSYGIENENILRGIVESANQTWFRNLCSLPEAIFFIKRDEFSHLLLYRPH